MSDDLVVVLLSGGASANWIAPAKNLTLAEKQAVTRALLRSGANIGEINTVRKHLSRIKGGRLAHRAQPAGVVTLAISDVPGDDPAVIGSGPTVPDPTTLADARAIVSKYRLKVPEAVTRALADPSQRIAEAGRGILCRDQISRSSRGRLTRCAQRRHAQRRPGTKAWSWATACRAKHARSPPSMPRLARDLAAQGRRVAILSGGELTVTLRGQGQGGPNQEYALALAVHLDGAKGIAALAADTDGTDGGRGRPDDPAGAFVDETTIGRARAAGLDPAAFLADNDSTGFFNGIGDLFRPGPTFTNVTDFRAITVDRPSR